MATWVLLEILMPKLSACVYARRTRPGGAAGGHHGSSAASDADASTAPAMAARPTSPASGGSSHNSGAGAVAVEVPTSPSSASASSSDASRGLRKPTVPWGSATAVGAASGGLAGLVAITPAAGMVSQMIGA
jgi:hypothetical protein